MASPKLMPTGMAWMENEFPVVPITNSLTNLAMFGKWWPMQWMEQQQNMGQN